ncbi:MAG: hypothetical protein QFC55_04410, partial [Chloroflexota bacterium]|nr:hypothetical protein [Chloroflexota bacterium]
MAGRHEFDYDAAALHALDRLVAGVHAEFFSDSLLDSDLAALTDPVGHTYSSDKYIRDRLSMTKRQAGSQG